MLECGLELRRVYLPENPFGASLKAPSFRASCLAQSS